MVYYFKSTAGVDPSSIPAYYFRNVLSMSINALSSIVFISSSTLCLISDIYSLIALSKLTNSFYRISNLSLLSLLIFWKLLLSIFNAEWTSKNFFPSVSSIDTFHLSIFSSFVVNCYLRSISYSEVCLSRVLEIFSILFISLFKVSLTVFACLNVYLFIFSTDPFRSCIPISRAPCL